LLLAATADSIIDTQEWSTLVRFAWQNNEQDQLREGQQTADAVGRLGWENGNKAAAFLYQ
jgi:hypothetical protein